jgi:hypothetical protein
MVTISDAKYVRFTTFTRDGTPKSTPVWIADLGDGSLGFTTEADSWKAKRLANDDAVELAASSMRGDVADGAEVHKGTARMVSGDEASAVRARIKDKYGFQVTLIEWTQKAKKLFGRGELSDAAVVMVLDES